MPRKQHTYHYIYKTICKVTNRFYIGMHSTSNLEDGYIGSGKRLWNSINKHGRENHEIEILEYLPDRSSLKAREKEIVNEGLLQDPMCMNLQLGGGGGFISVENQHKRSSAGGKQTRINRENNSDLDLKMRTIFSESSKNAWKDPKHRANHTASISGEKNGFYKKTHTVEVQKRIIEGIKKSQKGEGNSQYGTCWIYNDEIKKCIKIKKNELSNYANLGWIKGMKMTYFKKK